MHNHKTIEQDLLNSDGSCRDINFSENISKSGAMGVYTFIASSWTLKQAMCGDGEEYDLRNLSVYLNRDSGSISTIWNGSKIPKNLQIYFFWTKPNQVFCEVTFFPEDLNAEQFSLKGFLLFLSKLVHAAESNEYYIRSENASWRYGEHGQNAGVIFSHKNLALPDNELTNQRKNLSTFLQHNTNT